MEKKGVRQTIKCKGERGVTNDQLLAMREREERQEGQFGQCDM
jgi:hypothetical protein